MAIEDVVGTLDRHQLRRRAGSLEGRRQPREAHVIESYRAGTTWPIHV
jgi:hypothetical protein